MDDRQRLEEHALGRKRLVGCTVHGSAWRERKRRDALRPLLAGLILALLVAAGFGVATYVGDQLDQQRQQRTGQLSPR